MTRALSLALLVALLFRAGNAAYDRWLSSDVATTPHGSSSIPLVGSTAKRTAWPVGRRYPFEFRFQRNVSCPDRIVWQWGGGEGTDVTRLTDDQRSDCVAFVVKVDHVFEHSIPRRVRAVAFLGPDEVARTCTWWPAGTPC